MNRVYCYVFALPVGLVFELVFAWRLSGLVYVAIVPDGAVCTVHA